MLLFPFGEIDTTLGKAKLSSLARARFRSSEQVRKIKQNVKGFTHPIFVRNDLDFVKENKNERRSCEYLNFFFF
jgi:hypothetical protein